MVYDASQLPLLLNSCTRLFDVSVTQILPLESTAICPAGSPNWPGLNMPLLLPELQVQEAALGAQQAALPLRVEQVVAEVRTPAHPLPPPSVICQVPLLSNFSTR